MATYTSNHELEIGVNNDLVVEIVVHWDYIPADRGSRIEPGHDAYLEYRGFEFEDGSTPDFELTDAYIDEITDSAYQQVGEAIEGEYYDRADALYDAWRDSQIDNF